MPHALRGGAGAGGSAVALRAAGATVVGGGSLATAGATRPRAVPGRCSPIRCARSWSFSLSGSCDGTVTNLMSVPSDGLERKGSHESGGGWSISWGFRSVERWLPAGGRGATAALLRMRITPSRSRWVIRQVCACRWVEGAWTPCAAAIIPSRAQAQHRHQRLRMGRCAVRGTRDAGR